MPETIIYLDPESPLNLQKQIRQKLVEGILTGALPPGHKLPSSRKLAEQLDVARNTVVLAYQQLVADGYLVSRSRSGIFVNEEMLETRVGYGAETVPTSVERAAAWKKRTKRPEFAGRSGSQGLPNWDHYPYPFIDGKFDASLFPIAEWREASRLALGVAEVKQWSTGRGDADDAMLVEEIRSKILTRRGIQARSDEILITMGNAEQPLHGDPAARGSDRYSGDRGTRQQRDARTVAAKRRPASSRRRLTRKALSSTETSMTATSRT